MIPDLNYLLRHILSPRYNQLGWKDEGTHNERLLRNLILTHSVASKMPEAESRAIQFFQDLKKNQKPVSPDFRWITYSAGKFTFFLLLKNKEEV